MVAVVLAVKGHALEVVDQIVREDALEVAALTVLDHALANALITVLFVLLVEVLVCLGVPVALEVVLVAAEVAVKDVVLGVPMNVLQHAQVVVMIHAQARAVMIAIMGVKQLVLLVLVHALVVVTMAVQRHL